MSYIAKRTIKLKLGDFSGLASNYSAYRPSYCSSIRDAILAIAGKPSSDMQIADLGAGTGIWTRMMSDKQGISVSAVEPNFDMLTQGELDSEGLPITWYQAPAEETGLGDNQFDLVTMASSFHWVDFEKGLSEISRISKPQGWFVALWNPRVLDKDPLISKIENKVFELAPDINRKSSGRSNFTENLGHRFEQHEKIDKTMYMEATHFKTFLKEEYLGVWLSVNDIPAQMGPKKWQNFLSFIEETLQDVEVVNAEYLTRSWLARLK